MHSPGLERTARLIEENVASAVERNLNKGALHPLMREALLVELLRALLPAMPTQSAAAQVATCNRCLDYFAGFQGPGRRIKAIDLADGSVTTRRG